MNETAVPAGIPALPPRPRDGHKGTFGHVLCLAGSASYTGAAILCSRAALRGGAGMVTLGHPRSIGPQLAAHLVCEIAHPLGDEGGAFSADATQDALLLAEARTVVALGPGISRAPGAAAFAHEIGVSAARPTVIDADGLNAFEDRAADLVGAPAPRVVTPHPGEASRLLGRPPGTITAAPADAARELAGRTQAVVVLKGGPTFVSDGSREFRNTTGNPGMATAGSGDVLTGLIAALLAQGMDAFDAAVLGVYLHGLAGDLAASALGEHGMIASDILDHLPHAFREHARTAPARGR